MPENRLPFFLSWAQTFHLCTYLWPWHFYKPGPSLSHSSTLIAPGYPSLFMVVLTEQVIINKENKHERLHDIVGKE